MMNDTIVAIATAISPSGIGIIRVSGEKALEILDPLVVLKNKKKRILNVETHTLNYGFFMDIKKQQTVDEVLVSVMKAPNSFTTENVVEINAHGGIIVVQRILRIIMENGARLAEPGEFTKRAFLNGRIDLSQAEAVIDIINSKTDLAHDASVNQLKGAVSAQIQEIKKLTLSLIAHVEASIDYPEYDIEELTPENILLKINLIYEKIELLLNSYDEGKIIKEGIKTVIVGKPNVGKSSLLNTLLKEQRAIVTDVPGTTRDVLEEYMNIHGVPLRLIDTAGIRETEDVVEKIGVKKSKEKIEQADLVLMMMDVSQPITNEDLEIFHLIHHKRKMILLNKMDLKPIISEQDLRRYEKDAVIISVSLKTLEGIQLLEQEIKDMFMLGKINFNDHVYITSVRHKAALDQAMVHIEHLKRALESGLSLDFLAIDLKNIYDSICQITGDSMSEDLLHQIFSQFCLGK